MAEYHKIGVWQTAFLGDAVLTLPLLNALNLRFPGAEVHYFVRGGLDSLFAPQPGLASVRAYDKRGAHKGLGRAWEYGRALGREGFDLWVSSHVSLRSALLSRATAIPRRIGYGRPWFNRLAYTDTVDRRFNELAEVERLMELARPLGIEGPPPETRLGLDPAAEERAGEFYAKLQGPVLGVHPGSTWPTKQWPSEYFSRTMALAVQAGVRVLVFGGPGEQALAGELAARTRELSGTAASDAVLDLSGQLKLPDLAAHIARLGAYLTNDSGPMHMAWMLDVPLVALFGPTVRSLGFFPRGPGSTVLEVDLDCRPCGLHGPRRCPRGHHRCMTELSPEQAWAALAPKLDK